MKKILVIGATGQIGSELTMKLRGVYGNDNVVAGYITGAEPNEMLRESEDGFSRRTGKHRCVATVPDTKSSAGVGSDQSRWTGEKAGAQINATDSKGEKTITQEMRQLAYDNWETTDDHGMQIYGLAKDQNGKEYFMMKNSWGDYGPYKGDRKSTRLNSSH